MRQILLITMFGVALPLALVLVTQSVRADDEAPAADAGSIEKLVEQLGADDFKTRESASKQLEALGAKARPALEKALEGEAGPEVRWRATQILKRLEGADQERRLDAPEGRRPAPGQPGQQPGRPGGVSPFPGGLRGEDVDEAMRKLEEMLERFGTRRPGGLGSLLGTQRITAPGLVLERGFMGGVTLRVAREQDAGPTVEDVYRGQDLADILARHPELAEHAGMEELKQREAEADWPGKPDFPNPFEGFRIQPGPGGSFGMTMRSSGVEIRQDAEGVTVKIREKDADGKDVVKEYKGATIDEIKEKHPELADKLGSFSIRVMPPQVFWPGARQRRLNPLDRPLTPRPQVTGKSVFGLTLTDVSPALASHLELEAGRGAMVANVLPGSQAEAMGLLRHDIILEVGGQGVGVQEAADLLRTAGAEKAPLEITLIRRGERKTLGR